ncbi:MAG: gluconate 2-dehydrogenase subunit 3 family protein [Solirubrobacteraceae bacterium]
MAQARVQSSAGHLPKQGSDTSPGPPAQLPRQRRGTTPQMRGRYPDYDVLGAAPHWDAKTRAVVLDRVANVPPIRFFNEEQSQTLSAFCDVVTGQDSEPRIPVLEMVDAKLYAGHLDGFRHHDMPADPDTWRQVAANLDRSARERGAEAGFAGADSPLRHEIVQMFSEGEIDWDMPVSKAWGVVMRGVLGAFYSHPWAWSEIGFGGPAYPRGYARLGAGQREHWEAPPEFAIDPVADVRRRGIE